MAGTSVISIQQNIILETIRGTDLGEWKVLILDGESRKLIHGVVGEDDILGLNVSNIEQIEERRPTNKEMDAVYLLSPLPHIMDCLMADLERRRYRRTFLVWTSLLPPDLQARLDRSAMAKQQIVYASVLNVDYYPRESHLITFRDPWSFPTLFHPACNHLVRRHMEELAQKIVSLCVSLGEYPTIRYYNPKKPSHEASILCSHLARFVQTQLDQHAKYNTDFPPLSSRPRGVLIIADRSLDLFAPLLHEFTYQAMVHDLLPLTEGDKVYYKPSASQAGKAQRDKDQEIGEKDSVWVKFRHLHMKDLLDEMVKDFNAFKAQNPQFADSENPATINSIKDMLAGLPKFQQGKEAYSLHLSMTQDAMNVFQERRLADIASVEQSLATGLDEDYKKPKNLADQVIRLLDDDAIEFPDRLRLIIQYLLYRDGLLPTDIQKLLAHARLPAQDSEVIYNLELLGAHVNRALKDSRPAANYQFGKKEVQAQASNESGLSRFEPALKVVLEDHCRGALDENIFPFTKPHLDATEGLIGQEHVSQASLRSAKPTWARTRPSTTEPRQRVMVFMAGGATYSESRACYEVSQSLNKDVYLSTSHMLTPSLYLRQVGDLSVDRRRLDLPADRPQPRAPDHLFEKEMPAPPPPAPSYKAQAPVEDMQQMRINDDRTHRKPINGTHQHQPSPPQSASSAGGRLVKDKDREGEKKKKKHNFFGSKK
ncbi:syntaxin binding protein 1 [Xanthoria calcicola]